MAPHARSYRLRRGDLDSEGEDERSCSERRVLSGLTTERRRTRWRGEAKRRDDDGVLAVRRGHSTSHFPRTNAAVPAAMSGQSSFAATLGLLFGSRCSHEAAETACGWHKATHNSEAVGPTASVNTIERRAARNTGCSSCVGQDADQAREVLRREIPNDFA